ncbi:hypothetical protein MTO96_027350 [Rhipicephalus appendiculatus]
MSTVLETCFRTGLPSIVTAFATTGDVGIEPGTTLANSLNDKNGTNVFAFIEWAMREHELPNDTHLLLFLRHIDTKLDDIRLTFERTYPSKNLSITELESLFPGFSWTAVFRHAFYNGTMFTSDSFIRIWGLEQVKAIVATLFAERTIYANLYTLLLALAQLAKYEYILPPSGAPDHDIAASCLEVTGQYFPTLFAAWVAQVVIPPSSVDYAEDMISVFRLLAHEAPPLSDKVNVSTTDILRQRIAVIGATRGDTWRCSRKPPVIYRKDFLSNVVLAANEEEPLSLDVRHSARTAAQRQLDGSFTVDINTDTLMVPALYLTADLLHPDANEPVLDYSTVGARVLAEWAHMLLSHRPTFP